MAQPTDTATTLLRDLTGEVRQHLRAGRIVVAVDGLPGAGQSAFADAFAAAFAEQGAAVFRASAGTFETVDEPYGPRADAAALKRLLLDPFRAGAGFATGGAEGTREVAPADAVLIVDGAFLLAPELRGLWNWSVWLEAHATAAAARLTSEHPDASTDEVLERARAYRRVADPRSSASALVENTDSDAPVRMFGDFC